MVNKAAVELLHARNANAELTDKVQYDDSFKFRKIMK